MSDVDIPSRPTVTVARGNLYLARELCDAYFPGTNSVALLEREGCLLIVPLIAESSGGLLLKVRNARGDRMLHAQEFFRARGYVEDDEERNCPVLWRAEVAALEIMGIFATKM
ncbi:MAG: hypothetical protein AB1469_05800 [Pseudomonadota bacterium]